MSKTISDVLEYLYQKDEKELADCVLKELLTYKVVSNQPTFMNYVGYPDKVNSLTITHAHFGAWSGSTK